MSQLTQFAEVGNGRNNNKKFTLNAGESVICYFQASGGVDSATAKYFNLGDSAMRCAILVSAAATMTHMGGHELDSPLTLGVGGWNSFTKGIRWEKITVRADTDATTFEVLAY